jgi:radical SAM superfamily enzyme YgiQ (UPF0313 family)
MTTKVLLVNPAGTEQDGFTNPPLNLLYLAGTLLKHDIGVRVVDACIDGHGSVEDAIRTYSPDYVGVSCLTPRRHAAYDVCKTAKEIDSKIITVIGGAHASIMYRQIAANYPFIDYIIRGEGENTLLDIVVGREHNRIPPLQRVNDLDTIPFPAWSLIDLQRYPARGEGIVNGIDLSVHPRVSIIFSRGCIGHCTFCSTWWIWQGYRHRSPENMVDEIQVLYDMGIRHFCFADDSLTIDRQATIKLCDLINERGLKIAFHATTRSDAVDLELLLKLKEAGCYEIAYGVETGSSKLLKQMGKENDIDTNLKAIKMTRKAGIKSTALLIIGGIGETWDTVKETKKFIRKARPDHIVAVGGLWILPGTQVYNQCKDKGLIRDDYWLSDKPYMVYTFEHLQREIDQMVRYVTKRSLFDKVSEQFN